MTLCILRSVSVVACAFLALSATAQTLASPPPATYNQILVDTQRITNEYQLMTIIGARAVALDLVGFGKGSDAFFQRGHRQDEIGFVCMNTTFKGGAMTGTIVRTEVSPDTGRFYFLKDCAPMRKK